MHLKLLAILSRNQYGKADQTEIRKLDWYPQQQYQSQIQFICLL